MSDVREPSSGGTPIETEVVIVGGGPVGVALAILLGQADVRSVVIESHDDIYPLPRAVHLDDEVYRILNALGIGREFAGISRSAGGLRLVDRNHKTIAQFDRDAEPASGLPEASLFDQPELERLLRQRLAAVPNARTLFGWTAESIAETANWVTVRASSGEASETEVRGRYLVGCDGANSWIRRQLNLRTEDLGFEQRWLVIDGRCDAELDAWGGVYQICDPAQPGTFMRIGDDRYRWEFRLDRDDRRTDWDDSRLRHLLEPWTAPAGDPDVELVRVAEYTFKAESASHWRSGRAFLAGDAAHLTPPFIGQGLGSGLRDAQNLAWKLAAVLHATAPDSLLDSYEAERRPHAVALIRKAKMIGTVMTGKAPAARMVRGALMPLAARIRPLEQQILSSTSPALGVGPGRIAGTLVPRVELPSSTTPSAAPITIDDLLGSGLTLLTLDGVLPADVTAPLAVIRISASGTPGEGALAAWLGRARGTWAIIRPDRTVLASGRSGVLLSHKTRAVLAPFALAE